MPVVLGGGLSGLAAAYYLAKHYVNPVSLYESSKRVGGWVRSEDHSDHGFLFESGPRTIRPKGPAAANTLELIEEIGLRDEVHPIHSTHPAAKHRMVFVKNELCLLPSSLGGIFQTNPPFSKPLVSGIFHDILAPRSKKRIEDESIYDFAIRRFGQEIADFAISPMICGICAGDAKEISVRFLMNDIFEKEQKYGGVIKGMIMNKMFGTRPQNPILDSARKSKLAKQAKKENWSIYTVKGGLENLPKKLAEVIQHEGVDIRTNSECSRLAFCDHGVSLTVNGWETKTDFVFSSIPAYGLAKLVESQHPTLACQLRAIPYVDVAVVNLQYTSTGLLPIDAFGFLVPPSENLPILGVIFDSCCTNMHGNTVLTVMMGGKWFKDHFGDKPSQKALADTAVAHVENILGIRCSPNLVKVNILKNCIPQYTVGHKNRVESIRNYIKKYSLPLAVCGAAYDGVGVNDVLLSAKAEVFSNLYDMGNV